MSEWGIIVALGGVTLGALGWLLATRRRAKRLSHALSMVRADNGRLRTDLERLRTSQSFSGIGTWDWLVNTETLHWSDEVYPMFGFAVGEIQPTYSLFCSMVHPEDAARVRGGEIVTLHSGRPHDQEYRVVWRDGTVRWLRETGDIIRDATGRPVRMIGTVRDISDDKTREQRMLHQAFHDELTGLPNRAFFRVHLDDALTRVRRSSTLAAVAFVDLNKFKPINDTLGHAAGDAVLATLADRLRAGVRASDYVARLGGDEFVVVFEGLHRPEEVEPLAEKLLAAIRAPVPYEDRHLKLDASIGIALYPLDAETPELLVERADQAMYEAKAARVGYRLAVTEQA